MPSSDFDDRKMLSQPAAADYLRGVQCFRSLMFILVLAGVVPSGGAASARLVKVLPHFEDSKGRIALNPSLYERDAYQVHLRKHPDERGGMRFDVQWKSRDTTRATLRLELRGNRGQVGTTETLEEAVVHRGLFGTWSEMHLKGERYVKFGELSAWRATLWDGDTLLAEQKSFLW
jgi:hypothetical protein